jgi:hypothetical protein
MAAIYMWRIEGGLLLTTTLYPYEEDLEIQFEGDIASIDLVARNEDTSQIGAWSMVPNIEDILITVPGDEDTTSIVSWNMTPSVQDILLELPGDDDTASVESWSMTPNIVDVVINANHEETGIETTIGIEEIIYAPNP